MSDAIYTAMHAAQHAQTAQKVLTNNLANINVAGFKADSIYAVTQQISDQSFLPFTQDVLVEQTSAELKQTTDKHDLAIAEAKQWFVLEQNGEASLSRSLRWQLSVSNELITEDGRQVMGQEGNIVIPFGEQVEVTNEGKVFSIRTDNGDQLRTFVDTLDIVRVEGALTKNGVGHLVPFANADVRAVNEAKVAIGYQESSNVSAMAVMAEVMELTQTFEAQMQAAQNIAENNEQATQLLSLS